MEIICAEETRTRWGRRNLGISLCINILAKRVITFLIPKCLFIRSVFDTLMLYHISNMHLASKVKISIKVLSVHDKDASSFGSEELRASSTHPSFQDYCI